MTKALGMIETKGLLAAIEAADVMLKSADVVLLGKDFAGGGLVSVSVAGEVAAVRSAVDTAVESVSRINETALVSRHVIARPDRELAAIISLCPSAGRGCACGSATPGIRREQQPAVNTNGAAHSPPTVAPCADRPEKPAPRKEQLKRMSLAELRYLARTTEGIALSDEALASAAKKFLIEAIVAAAKKKEE